MTPRHRIGNESFTEQGGVVIMRSWYHVCGLPVITRGRSAGQARKRSRRAYRAHRGFAYAAGPGRGVAA